MSGPAATTRAIRLRRTAPRIWGCGLIVACALVAALPATSAQLPEPDSRPPLPVDPSTLRYQIPNPDRGLFVRIEDDTELLSEAKNWEEYAAYTEVVQHAKQFTAAELERHASRDFVREDLLHVVSRTQARIALMRFDGKLTKFRTVRLTRALAEAWLAEQSELAASLGLSIAPDTFGGLGVKVMYQGWMVPLGEPASRPICLMFTDLPPGMTAPPTLGQYVEVDRWASFAGYSFKVLAYPGPGGNPENPKDGGWLRAPLLVGVSFTPIPEPTPDIKLNKGLRIFGKIADDAPMPVVTAQDDNWEELEAWNHVILHARQFSPEQLEQASLKKLTFGDLFKDVRRDHKLEVIHFEGQLVRLREFPATEKLKEAGIPVYYEGWLIPRNEPAGNPICFAITELPAGLETQAPGRGLMNKWVAFDGYSFKLMRYDSAERDDKEKSITKKAPFLIGRTVRMLNEGKENVYGWDKFVPFVLGGLLFLVLLAVALSWWFRRGDRVAKTEIDAVRHKNPFDE